MKKIALSIFCFMMSLSFTNCNSQKQFSDKSKSEKLTTLENTTVSFGEILDKHKGKTIVIEVWASWCGDCVKAMPKLKELQATNPDVVYIFISADKTFDKWKLGIEKHELKGEQYWIDDADGMKGSFGKSIDLDWIPRYIIINKNQEVLTYRAIETDFDKINTTLKSLK